MASFKASPKFIHLQKFYQRTSLYVLVDLNHCLEMDYNGDMFEWIRRFGDAKSARFEKPRNGRLDEVRCHFQFSNSQEACRTLIRVKNEKGVKVFFGSNYLCKYYLRSGKCTNSNCNYLHENPEPQDYAHSQNLTGKEISDLHFCEALEILGHNSYSLGSSNSHERDYNQNRRANDSQRQIRSEAQVSNDMYCPLRKGSNETNDNNSKKAPVKPDVADNELSSFNKRLSRECVRRPIMLKKKSVYFDFDHHCHKISTKTKRVTATENEMFRFESKEMRRFRREAQLVNIKFLANSRIMSQEHILDFEPSYYFPKNESN